MYFLANLYSTYFTQVDLSMYWLFESYPVDVKSLGVERFDLLSRFMIVTMKCWYIFEYIFELNFYINMFILPVNSIILNKSKHSYWIGKFNNYFYLNLEFNN
jgi:hypothetical protein